MMARIEAMNRGTTSLHFVFVEDRPTAILDALSGQFRGYARDAGDVSTWSGKAHDRARADRISGLGHHDRDFPRRLLCRHSGGREPSDDDIDLETNQLSCQFGKPVDLSFRRPKLKSNVLPLDIPQIA